MVDLIIGICVLLVLASVFFRCGRYYGQRSPEAVWASGLALAATLGWALYIQGQLFLADLFPVSSIIVLSNWLPLTTAFLAGVVHNCNDIPPWRRTMIMLCLLAAGWVTVAWTILPLSEVTSMRRFVNGICVQSVPNSCSACTSVTLLDHYGIRTDETEMARLCLTSGRGTQLLGIYRGLKLKTQGTTYDVEVVRCDFDQLLAYDKYPILAPLKQDLSIYDNEVNWGAQLRSWVANSFLRVDHCVILYSADGGRSMSIGDPSSMLHNPVRRSVEDVRDSWLGVGFRIVPK